MIPCHKPTTSGRSATEQKKDNLSTGSLQEAIPRWRNRGLSCFPEAAVGGITDPGNVSIREVAVTRPFALAEVRGIVIRAC